MSGTEFLIEVQGKVPEELSGLSILANDLTYSWNRKIRSLFHRLDRQLWSDCGHIPKVFLRRVDQKYLEAAIQNDDYMKDYQDALAWHHEYCQRETRAIVSNVLDPSTDLIAYFSAEFGFHESLPIYSGGLGILAGDHCKAASDLALPFVAVGLLYHQGYFTQTIDANGHQIAVYRTHHFNNLPIKLVSNKDGTPLLIQVEIADRVVDLSVWKAKAGNINLFLLDSDIETNSKDDRSITYRLYGGDQNTRIQQEIVLGIGGVRTLRALGLSPSVWHINEGHSAFQVIERLCEYVKAGVDYYTARELVAADTVFTTHTPVPAGHDIFEPDLIGHYLSSYIETLNISFEEFLSFGNSGADLGSFNMTNLALRGSRFHNGVSKIHGDIASEMQSHVWPDIDPVENPISFVTNGVHVSTFLASEWAELFDSRFPDWRQQLSNVSFWKCLDDIKDNRYWNIHHKLRAKMLKHVCKRVIRRYQRNGCSETLIRKTTQYLAQPDQDILVLGFARRFATYKRATLLFSHEDRLKKLLNDPERPVLLIFAGKAHPKDEPGQHLIKVIHDFSQKPEFIGKIILLENYDVSLARKLITGVDVWINTPEYPMEACGTSGQKAGLNGVLNLSVLDGWWGEGYNGKNGWAVIPHGPHYDPSYRDYHEASDLIDILEHQVIPTYYDRDSLGYSEKWTDMCKESMKSIIPRFNSERMVTEYSHKFYAPAIQQYQQLMQNQHAAATELADWKQKIQRVWPEISIQLAQDIPEALMQKENLSLTINANLGELQAEDVRVELLIGEKHRIHDEFMAKQAHIFEPASPNAAGEIQFKLCTTLKDCGLQHFKIRIYPFHKLLAHPLEMGHMLWL